MIAHEMLSFNAVLNICAIEIVYCGVWNGKPLSEEDFTETTILSVDALLRISEPWSDDNTYEGYFKYLYSTQTQNLKAETEQVSMIDNLAEYVHPFGRQQCFLVINNFFGVNIPEMDYPVVIKFPKLVAILFKIFNQQNKVRLFWLPHHLYPKNGSSNAGLILKNNCRLSKFLADFRQVLAHFFPDYCLRITLGMFSPLTKPWNCQAQFGLFPLMELYNPGDSLPYYPRNFKFSYIRSDLNLDVTLPSSAPSINLVFTRDSENSRLGNFQGLMVALFYHSSEWGLRPRHISHETFFRAILTERSSKSCMDEPRVTVLHLHLLKVSYEDLLLQRLHIPRRGSPILAKYMRQRYKPADFSQMMDFTSSPSATEMLIWELNGYFSCISQDRLHKDTRELMIHKLSKTRTAAWQSIFGNYTFRYKKGLVCSNGILKPLNLPRGKNLYLDFHKVTLYSLRNPMMIKYEDTLKRLRFISCSEVQQEAFLFSELVSIYDLPVWLCLVIEMLLLAISISYLGRKGSIAANILGAFKAIVGHGDPFSKKVMNSPAFRAPVVVFLMMGIIIGEGYKNSNVYNIISPRKIIPKRWFAELVEENFTVYSRSSVVEFRLELGGNPDNLEFETFNNHVFFAVDLIGDNINGKNPNMAVARSEVDSAVNVGRRATSLQKALGKHSSLHPSLYSLIREAALRHKSWFIHLVLNKKNYNATVTTKRRRKLQELVQMQEEEILFRFIQNCDKAALIMPEYVCANYAKRLRISKQQFISVGKELFPSASYGEYLSGLIPPVVIKRIRGIEVSGILNWNPLIIDKWKKYQSSTISSMPTRAKISGNILVIFIMLSGGLLIGTFSFFLEHCAFKTVKVSIVEIPMVELPKNRVNFSDEIRSILYLLADFVLSQIYLKPIQNHSAT